ncbi:hypothetical protein ACXZ9C_11465 [Streptococcus agalactiae]
MAWRQRARGVVGACVALVASRRVASSHRVGVAWRRRVASRRVGVARRVASRGARRVARASRRAWRRVGVVGLA